jgi:hypothetical protein
MSNISDLKPENQSYLSSNIRLIKIIAIVLGLLIILGLFVLFIGLANNYNNIEKSNKFKEDKVSINEYNLNPFNFIEPFDAQLISSSLGQRNEILLRYLYEGKNVLVILNSKRRQVTSIVTLQKGTEFSIKQ